MVTAWILFATTAIIIARYYKFIFPSVKPLDTQIWFWIHRTIMILVSIASIAGFTIILADLNWSWTSTFSSITFAHSVTGILVIFLSVIQVKKSQLCHFIFQT